MNKLWQALGGRKFMMAVVLAGIGTAVELLTDRGMSEVYGGFLALIYMSFSASNYMNSKAYLGKDAGKQVINNQVDKKALKELQSSVNVLQDAMGPVAQTVHNTHTLVKGVINAGANTQVPR